MEDDDVTYPTRLFLFISTFAIFSTLFHPSAAANAAKDDAAVLQKLSFSLKPAPKDWLGDPCNWRGVHCDSSGHVDYLDFRKFGLTGQLPPELAKLSRLKSIFLQGNSFSGPFPPFSDLPYLEQVFLNGNQFNSVPSGFLKGLTGLKSLNIQDNPISPPWNFPDSLADSTSLTTLDADNCSLFGTLPDIFGSLSNLQDIRLSYNNLTGPLPPSLAKTGIQNLWLNNQDMGFSGRIDVLGQMPHLAQVWLHKNQFTGPIPDLSKAVSLFDLSLRENELTGPVPPSLSDLPKLLNISLQKNMLQGPLPSFRSEVKVDLGDVSRFCNPCDPQVITLLEIAGGIGYPLVLAQSWVGNNPCKGWMSVTCNNQGSVTELNLAKRDFVGRISPSFANLSSLTKIDLSNNSLTGIIPPDLTRLSNLELLDISYNNISGKLPNFRSNVVVKRDGNPFFGRDIPLDGDSSGGGSLGKKGKVWVIVISILVVLIVLAFVAFILYKRYLKKRKGKNNWFKDPEKSNKRTPRKGPETSPKAFTGYTSDKPSVSSGEHSDLHGYENGSIIIPIEVLREVTDNFSEYNILGHGGFGVVYRGQLPDGTQIAVKRMEVGMASSKGLSEFEAEIAVLSKVRHRHLVALHGFCVNGNERLLVYEYMPQGTLGQHLFSYRELGIPPLTWKQRVTVLLDVARGVEYLHSLAQQSFIHRDLKPSNVLLDDDLRAKVSDFGLVRNAPDGKHSLETRLAGTFGYLAPEYAATGKVTTKVDVFAFGVILMEAMTGRKALDENLPDEQCHLVSWFRRVIVQNNLADLRQSLDPVLETDEETFASICKAAELAGHCTAREPHQRPDMGHAVSVLSPLVQQWKPSAKSDEDSFAIDLDMSLPQALQKWQSSEGNTSTTMSTTFNPSDYSAPKGNSFNWRNGK